MALTNRLSICHTIGAFIPDTQGGHITYTIQFGENINRYCRSQFLIVPKAEEDNTELDRSFLFEICRVNYFKFKWLRRLKAKKYLKWLPLAPLMDLSCLRFLPQIFYLDRKHGIDIVVCHDISTSIVATIAGKLLHKPVVWQVHGCAGTPSSLADRYQTVVTKLFRPDSVFVGDRGLSEKFTGLLGRDKVTAVRYAVDTERFCPRQANRQLLKDLGLESTFVIASPHRLVPFKGVEHAISAFKQFLESSPSPDAVLLIIGDGALRRKLEELAADLGIAERVLFLGEIDYRQIPDYLSISGVIVATSTISNSNSSAREGMACGKPVLAFNCGETDALIHHMETGLLAESGSIADLAQKMLMLSQSSELRDKIGKNARSFIEENHSWESVIKCHLEVYTELIQRKRT